MTLPGRGQGEPKVLLVDGHSLAYRAFYGYPAENFMTSTGQHTNAVFGFLTLLLSIVRSEQPSHIGVAFDHSRITFRTKAYDAYKANRSATPDEFKGQVEIIRDVLSAIGVTHLDLADFEGDDIIATWATQARAADMAVLISTGDRDSFQLVSDQVTVLYPGRSEIQRVTPEAIKKKYGVTPLGYAELAALVGETSDNLPGVPGVGPKTAAKWLNQFEGLENLIRRAGQVTGKAGESLRAHLDDVERNRRLNALVRDLDLPAKATALTLGQTDLAALDQLFDTLQFRAIRTRVRETFGLEAAAPVTVKPEIETTPVVRLESGQIGPWLAAHATGRTGVQFQGRWGHGAWDVEAIGLAGADGDAAWFDVTGLTPADDRAVADWLAGPSPKVVHDVKEPLIGLWQRGWDLGGVVCDTQMAA